MNLSRHPCYDIGAKGTFGRVHLPVAPECNIKCNYCNRRYDCVNESRPGVTSKVLSPGQAIRYLEQVIEKEPRITVAGIAGPGDPLASGEATMETLHLVRQKFPDLILCLATNGLGLVPYLDRLAELRVSHITITVNAVEPTVGEVIYAWVREGKSTYHGRAASELLLARQLKAIRELKKREFIVKVNTIVIQGKNDHHVNEVAHLMGLMGVDVMNCIPMYPNPDTLFENIPQPAEAVMSTIRSQAAEYISQIEHCTRCRADAVGLLEEDRTEEFRDCLSMCSSLPLKPEESRPYVAVASYEGMMVNMHLGQASRLLIYEKTKEGYGFIEARTTPPPGGGQERWLTLADTLKDCRALLTSGLGSTPKIILEQKGIRTVEMYGFIEQGLRAIYQSGDVHFLKGRRTNCTQAAGCSGAGMGCG